MAPPTDSQVPQPSQKITESSNPSAADTETVLKRLRQIGLNEKESQERHEQLRRASVLVLISSDLKILLTKRTDHLKSHPGQVCFPGGKQDPEDKGDDMVTALRETHEEVGLQLTTTTATNDASQSLMLVEPLCRLRTFESINHLCVTPIVVFSSQTSGDITAKITINEQEVAAVFWTPLEYFGIATPIEKYEIEWHGETFVYRKYQYTRPDDDHVFDITGLTAHIAHELSVIAYPPTKEDAKSMETQGVHIAGTTTSGYLWRLHDETSKNPYWTKRYYVLSGTVLHEYDNEEHARRKAHTANKKHRWNVEDVEIEDSMGPETNSKTEKHAFQLSILDGRIVWKLAATSVQDKETWKSRLLQG